MAKKDLSKTFSDMESDEFSLEISAPTDWSLSPDIIVENQNERNKHKGKENSKVTKQLIERKQLIHDLQLLKIELSQKTLLIDNLKAEHMQKAEELQEKLSETLHQKQILQARLESQLKVQEADSRQRQDQIKREVESILKRQQDLESTNLRLQEKAGALRRSLVDLNLSEDEYLELKSKGEDDWSLRDFVAVKFYEFSKPMKDSQLEYERRCEHAEQEMKICLDELQVVRQSLENERRGKDEALIRVDRLTLELADTQGQVQQGNYKVENYDRVKLERDSLEHDYLDLKKQHTYTDTAFSAQTKDRDDLAKELASTKQSLALVTQDKDYLTKQMNELNNKVLFGEQKQQDLMSQLDDVKSAREELYEKYMNAREQYKSVYENKLREELENVRTRTNSEIDRLKTNTREMYERENRSLREARESAVTERERAVLGARDANTKCEQVMEELRKLQMTGDTKISELQNELKIKAFEAERTQMVYEETLKTLKQSQLDVDKLQKKMEVLTKEYYTLQTSSERKASEMDSQLADKAAKLETYEKLEQELDDVVMQAAEAEEEEDAERVLFSYGYGANVPSTAKRRLKQSVQLARRVLQLERANTSLRKEVERENLKTKQLAEELKNTNSVLDQAQQPYNYLVESIRSRDNQLQQNKQHISSLEDDNRRLEKERKNMMKAKNQMAADLERLLNQKEEMAVMKQVVLNLQSRRYGESKAPPRQVSRSTKTSTAVHRPQPTFEAEEQNTHKPGVTIVKGKDPPDWFGKLKQSGYHAR